MMRPEKGEYTLKPELEKPKYTTWQNTIYMLRKMWGWSKKDILISLLHIPPSVISPLILVVLSKILVDCLTGGVTPAQLITTVGVAILIYGVCCWLDKFIGGRMMLVNEQTRFHFEAEGFLKTLDTDYENIESLEGRIKRQRCAAFTQYGNGSGGSAVLTRVIALGVNVSGIFTYTAILSTLSIWLVLFLLAVSAASFLVLRWNNFRVYQFDRKQMLIRHKLDYLTHTAQNFAAGSWGMRMPHCCGKVCARRQPPTD